MQHDEPISKEINIPKCQLENKVEDITLPIQNPKKLIKKKSVDNFTKLEKKVILENSLKTENLNEKIYTSKLERTKIIGQMLK